jgi:hypothetical protein
MKWDRSTASKRVNQLLQSRFIKVTKQEIISGHVETWYALQLRGLLWILRESKDVQYDFERALKINLDTLGIQELDTMISFLDFLRQITREREKFHRLCMQPFVSNELFLSIDFQRASDSFLLETFTEMLYGLAHFGTWNPNRVKTIIGARRYPTWRKKLLSNLQLLKDSPFLTHLDNQMRIRKQEIQALETTREMIQAN